VKNNEDSNGREHKDGECPLQKVSMFHSACIQSANDWLCHMERQLSPSSGEHDKPEAGSPGYTVPQTREGGTNQSRKMKLGRRRQTEVASRKMIEIRSAELCRDHIPKVNVNELKVGYKWNRNVDLFDR